MMVNLLAPVNPARKGGGGNEHLINKIHHADAMDLLRAIDDNSVDLVLCDLPYGVTACAWDSIIPIEPMWAQLKRVVKQRAAIVLTATQPFTSRLVSSNYEMFRYEWIWVKERGMGFQIAKHRPLMQHESALVFSHQSPNYYPQMEKLDKPYKYSSASTASKSSPIAKMSKFVVVTDEKHPTNIIEINREIGLHPTQKPVALFEYLIRTYTRENEIVLDMTCGSGTTALAARKTGRRFICGDNSPEYVQLANTRLANSDPFLPTTFADGSKQLSLFSKLEVSA